MFKKKEKDVKTDDGNEKEQGKWLQSPWGEKYYFPLYDVPDYKSKGFIDCEPPLLPPGEEPFMVKDSSVTELYKKWLAEQGITKVDVNVSFTLNLRQEHLPFANMLQVSAASTPDTDPFRMQERAKDFYDLMAKNLLAPLHSE